MTTVARLGSSTFVHRAPRSVELLGRRPVNGTIALVLVDAAKLQAELPRGLVLVPVQGVPAGKHLVWVGLTDQVFVGIPNVRAQSGSQRLYTFTPKLEAAARGRVRSDVVATPWLSSSKHVIRKSVQHMRQFTDQPLLSQTPGGFAVFGSRLEFDTPSAQVAWAQGMVESGGVPGLPRGRYSLELTSLALHGVPHALSPWRQVSELNRL